MKKKKKMPSPATQYGTSNSYPNIHRSGK